MSYDVIVVGARVAGAATALLLARDGFRVLVVDRARFPSDTLSTHLIMAPGVERLRRWGLLDPLLAAGTPATRRISFTGGPVTVSGDVDLLVSPRRTVLDAMLVDAARAAGVEVRERCTVTGLATTGDRVGGVHIGPVTERARLVVGADGKHSTVAAAVGAASYRRQQPATFASYGYWTGVHAGGGELYRLPDRMVATFPTNDGCSLVYLAGPLAHFPAYRAGIEAGFLSTVDRCGDLGGRMRAGTRVERIRTTPDLPQEHRVPYGPGWLLVGDAGLVLDPITAQGITNALRDAESAAAAIAESLRHPDREHDAFARHHRTRDAAVRAMDAFTADSARFADGRALELVLAAIRDHPAEVERFLGLFTGTTPVGGYFAARNLVRVLGVRGVTRLVADRLTRR